jgi:hypothetical protein
MAVYPPDDPSPPPPPGVGLGIIQPAETDTDATEQAQPATQDEKDEKKKRWPRCLRWMLSKVVAQKERLKTKVSRPNIDPKIPLSRRTQKVAQEW